MFVTYRDMHIQAAEFFQGQFFEAFLVLAGGNVAIGHEDGVARVVVGLVEGLELLIAQVRYVRRITAAVVVVGGGREQVLAQLVPDQGRGRTHGALHFVVNDALVLERRIRIVRFGELQAVTFLGEIQLIQCREEDGIEVDLKQVVEILAVLAGKGVGSPVAARESVHEGVQGAADHHEEGITHREFAAAAQRGVFQYVCHTG